jgi:uncharacterized SAM-binding protein YcdF (DUF218 family)
VLARMRAERERTSPAQGRVFLVRRALLPDSSPRSRWAKPPAPPPMRASTSIGGAPAIVVLGCRVRVEASGRLCPGPLAWRLDAAALAYAEYSGASAPGIGPPAVVASGGRRWKGLVEADVMARELALRGVPASAIARERSSLSTGGNARFTARLLAEGGVTRAVVVTCAWHVPRAVALFRRAGIRAYGVGSREPATPTIRQRLWRAARERSLLWLQVGTLRAPAAERWDP